MILGKVRYPYKHLKDAGTDDYNGENGVLKKHFNDLQKVTGGEWREMTIQSIDD